MVAVIQGICLMVDRTLLVGGKEEIIAGATIRV